MSELERCKHDRLRWFCVRCNPPRRYMPIRDAVAVGVCLIVASSSLAWAISGRMGYDRGIRAPYDVRYIYEAKRNLVGAGAWLKNCDDEPVVKNGIATLTCIFTVGSPAN